MFIDATSYLNNSGLSAYDFTKKIINDVYTNTGITATAGIGTNLYLAKIAMDIVAKHADEDEDGVRVAELDEMLYRRLLWDHTPLTDFWRVGKGYERALNENGLYTMGDIARCSIGDVSAYHTSRMAMPTAKRLDVLDMVKNLPICVHDASIMDGYREVYSRKHFFKGKDGGYFAFSPLRELGHNPSIFRCVAEGLECRFCFDFPT